MNQGESSGGPSTQLTKRKRGRPCKDPSLKRAPSDPAPPQRADLTVKIDPMVGQTVTGFIEASFDAGVLVNVQIPNDNTNLRGVVFKPGHYVPITGLNDVAPQIQMIRRHEVNLPAMQTRPKKRKNAPRKTGPSVHPVGEKCNLVPVVLEPINLPNGLQQPSDSGDEDVLKVEPLSVLPAMSNNGSFNEGTSEVGQGEKPKPMTSDIDASEFSQTSATKIENGKEGVVLEQETGITTNVPLSTEALEADSVTKPVFSNGTGGMPEVLQDVQENMKEKQVQIAEEEAALASKVEVHENMTTDADEKEAANVP